MSGEGEEEMKKEDGGFDFDIHGEAPDHIECVICLHIVKEAMEPPCSHLLCKVCLEKLMKSPKVTNKQASCPTCNKLFSQDQVRANVFADRMIKSIKVRCQQHESGCTWVETISNYPDHVLKCPFQVTTCLLEGCGAITMRKNMTGHSKICLHRSVKCEYCEMETPLARLKEHHDRMCQLIPIDCPNQECNKKHPRFQMSDHLGHCDFQIIDCTFHKAGCNVKTQRKDLSEHLQGYIILHMSMHLNRTEEELSSLKNQNILLKEELEQAKAKIIVLEKEARESNDESNMKIRSLEQYVQTATERSIQDIKKLSTQQQDTERLCAVVAKNMNIGSQNLITKMYVALHTSENNRQLLQKNQLNYDRYFQDLLAKLDSNVVNYHQDMIVLKIQYDRQAKQGEKLLVYLELRLTFDSRKTSKEKCFDNESLVIKDQTVERGLYVLSILWDEQNCENWRVQDSTVELLHPLMAKTITMVPNWTSANGWEVTGDYVKDYIFNGHLLLCIRKK